MSKELIGFRVLAANNGFELFGHERGSIEVFKTLRSLGADIRVGTTALEGGGAFGSELRSLGFSTFELPFGPQWSIRWLYKEPSLIWRNPESVIACSLRFWREINTYHPTHLLLGDPLVYSFVAPAVWLSRLPLIYRSGDAASSDSWFNFPIWKSALNHAIRVVANSKYVKNDAIRYGIDGNKIELIYNLAPSRSVTTAVPFNVVESTKESFPNLVYVGNISKHKGLRELIKSISILRSRWPSVRADIVGGSRWECGFREELIKAISELGIEEHVNFHGFVADPSPFFRRSHVHLVPTIGDEPAANVVIEAKREGIPSVVFPSGGLPELVRHEIDGVVCDDKTPDSLANGVAWLLEDQERLRMAGEAAASDYRERFGPERFARQWASVMRDSPRFPAEYKG